MIESLADLLVVSDMDNTLLTAKEGVPSCNRVTIQLFCELGAGSRWPRAARGVGAGGAGGPGPVLPGHHLRGQRPLRHAGGQAH